MLFIGSIRRATPSTVTWVFCSSTSSGRSRMSNRAVISNSCASTWPMETSRRPCARRSARPPPAAPGRRPPREWCGGHIAGVEVHPGDAVVVALQEAVEDLGQLAPLGRAQPADDAEVHRGQHGGRGDEQVPLVQVGVEDAVVERLRPGRRGSACRPAPAGPAPAAPAPPGRTAAGPAAHSVVSTRLPTPSQITAGARMWPSSAITSPSSLGARRLEAQVELAAAASGRRWRPARAAPAAARRGPAARPAGRPCRMVAMSSATRRSMPGRSTFTATLRPSCRVAGCAWAREAAATGGLEAGEQLLDRPAELALDLGAGACSSGKGGSRSFSRRQVLGEACAEDVAAGRAAAGRA